MTGKSPDVVVVGSLNTDHVLRVERLPAEGETVAGSDYLVAAGGKGLNQAVAAARQGASVALVGCVGADDAGRRLRDLLVAEGIDVDHLRVVDDESSGVALVTVAGHGENTVVVAPLANGRLAPSDIAAAGSVIDGASVLLTQLEVPRAAIEAALRRARARGVTTVLNPAPVDGPLPGRLLGLVDVLIANQTEAAALTDLPGSGPAEVVTALRQLGPETVIVTHGSAGALAVRGAGLTEISPFPVAAVDSTGAGDAFCGALVAAVAVGLAFPVALRRASAAGALAVTVPGAVPSLPSASAVDDLVGGRGDQPV